MKTAELTGPALNWAVAKAEGRSYRYFQDYGGDYNGWTTGPHYLYFSTDWSQGGPIIEREWIELIQGGPIIEKEWIELIHDGNTWQAIGRGFGEDAPMGNGPTPLVAAMRCFVTSKLGDEVDVPEELL